MAWVRVPVELLGQCERVFPEERILSVVSIACRPPSRHLFRKLTLVNTLLSSLYSRGLTPLVKASSDTTVGWLFLQ